jgi:hypothetical protein
LHYQDVIQEKSTSSFNKIHNLMQKKFIFKFPLSGKVVVLQKIEEQNSSIDLSSFRSDIYLACKWKIGKHKKS